MNRVILLSLSILVTASGNELVANRFQNGCLQFMHENENHEKHPHTHPYMKERVCNSDDAAKGNTKCRKPEFLNYKEVRIGSGNRHGGSSLLVSTTREGPSFSFGREAMISITLNFYFITF